jgi:hypothetical protein
VSQWNSESDNGKSESKEGIEEHHHAGFRSGQNEQTVMKKGRDEAPLLCARHNSCPSGSGRERYVFAIC